MDTDFPESQDGLGQSPFIIGQTWLHLGTKVTGMLYYPLRAKLMTPLLLSILLAYCGFLDIHSSCAPLSGPQLLRDFNLGLGLAVRPTTGGALVAHDVDSRDRHVSGCGVHHVLVKSAGDTCESEVEFSIS